MPLTEWDDVIGAFSTDGSDDSLAIREHSDGLSRPALLEEPTRQGTVRASVRAGQPVLRLSIELEGRQATLLRELDAGVDLAGCAESLRCLVWTLSFRTRALRGQFADAGERAIDQMGAADDEAIKGALRREIDNNFDDHMSEFLAGLPTAQRAVVLGLLEQPGAAEAVRDHVRQEMLNCTPMVSPLLVKAAGVIREAASTGHVRGLATLLAQGVSIPSVFEVPSWSIVRFDPNTVILGDVVVFAVGPDGDSGALGKFTKNYAAIYMPISHDRVLVGRRGGDTPLLGLHEINAASAQLSFDTCFASRRTEVEEVASQIGAGEPLLSDEELRRIAAESWDSLGRPRPQE